MRNCSLVYTPCKNNFNSDKEPFTNYLCWDNKIHIRFRDYNSNQTIKGFEGKLTYLLSYLMNYGYLPKVLEKNNFKECDLIKDFLNTKAIITLCNNIRLFAMEDNFKGLKLSKNYKKDTDVIYFGKTDINCFPINDGSLEIRKDISLNSFLESFGNISLIEYLFNDAYSVVISEYKEDKKNKFIKKEERKLLKETSKENFVELW